MQISQELAEQIRDKAQLVLQRKVLVADLDGQILVGSTGATFSTEAMEASRTGQLVIASHTDSSIHWSPFVYERQAIGVLGVLTSNDQITGDVISLLQGLAEVIVHQNLLIDRISSDTVVKADFLKTLLTTQAINPDEARQQADILGLNLRSSQAVILFEIRGFEQTNLLGLSDLSREEQRLKVLQVVEAIDKLVGSSFENYQDNILAYAEHNNFILLKGIGGDSLNTLNTIRFMKEKADYLQKTLSTLYSKEQITIGVGQYYPDLGGLRKSYQDAQLALSVGLKVWGPGRIYHIKDVGMYITLANVGSERKAELAHQILNPLLRDSQLFGTVQAFLDNDLNLTDAASKLHIHRNTLIYRLDKTKKLINLDPRHFDDALQIKLGLMFNQNA